MPDLNGVHAIVVTHQPDLPLLAIELQALEKQVDAIWIIDNGSSTCMQGWLNQCQFSESLHLISMPENTGIGAAQNQGIVQAISHGASHILLMDQDTIPVADMVEALLMHAQRIPRLGAIASKYIDERRSDRSKLLHLEAPTSVNQAEAHPISHLIASGCLIPVSTLNAVGLMREDLFIDYVDTEWCLRATRQGYVHYQIDAVYMRHELGGMPLKLGSRTIASHSPTRHYYQYRNAVALYRDPAIPFVWKLKDGWRMGLKFLFLMIAARPRWSHFKMMCTGLWHGLRKVGGKYPATAPSSQ